MFNKSDVSLIKNDIESYVGSKVILTSKKGRKKAVVRQGVIESTYSSVFIVKLDVTEDQIPSNRRVSYNYIDVLTNAVEIVLDLGQSTMADAV